VSIAKNPAKCAAMAVDIAVEMCLDQARMTGRVSDPAGQPDLCERPATLSDGGAFV
jgi:hypothetical protein